MIEDLSLPRLLLEARKAFHTSANFEFLMHSDDPNAEPVIATKELLDQLELDAEKGRALGKAKGTAEEPV